MMEDAKGNIIGTLRIFESAAKAGVEKLVFASSGGTVYGDASISPTPEENPLRPISAYGVSKVAVERYLQLISYHSGMRGVSLRIANPYGPYQLAGLSIGLIANAAAKAYREEKIEIFGDGSVVRDYIWVEDVAEAFFLAATTGIEAGEYNIGSGEGRSINEILNLVDEVFPTPTIREYKPSRNFDVRRVILASEKFTMATGWRPRQNLRKGIENLLETLINKHK